jgi:hypothetical protein
VLDRPVAIADAVLSLIVSASTPVALVLDRPDDWSMGASRESRVGRIYCPTFGQAALHAGPLSVSRPLILVVDPIVSIILSVWLFGERLTGNPLQLAVAFVAFAVVAIGVVVLSIATPVHIEGRRAVRLWVGRRSPPFQA